MARVGGMEGAMAALQAEIAELRQKEAEREAENAELQREKEEENSQLKAEIAQLQCEKEASEARWRSEKEAMEARWRQEKEAREEETLRWSTEAVLQTDAAKYNLTELRDITEMGSLVRMGHAHRTVADTQNVLRGLIHATSWQVQQPDPSTSAPHD